MADEAGALQKEVGLETRDIGPVALPDLEHPELRQRAPCCAQRVAGQPQLRRQLGFLRQAVARSPGAGDDQALHLVDRLRGHARVASRTRRWSRVGHSLSIVRYWGHPAKRSDVIVSPGASARATCFRGLTNIGALAYNSEPRWVQGSCGPSRATSAFRPREPSTGRMR